MPKTIGRVETANSSKYLQQLCKHFAHKITVEHDTHSGRAEFSLGTATLKADDDVLTVEFDLNSAEDTAMAHRVIDSHLEKFAFREQITGLEWSTPAAG